LRALGCIAGLIALVAAATAQAQIYRWTDAQGREHFTERLERVPPEQRGAAMRAAASRSGRGALQTYAPAGRERPQAAAGGVVRIPFERAGSLMRVDAVVNDELTVPFLVDTGASGVSLSADVADRLGIRIDERTPRTWVRTANGLIDRPLVEIRSVQIGEARVESLLATVNPSLEIGLLGGAFLNNFVYSVDAAAGMLSLAPNGGIRSGLDENEWRERFRSLREPLARLEQHLAHSAVLRAGRREELERARDELRERLAALEREAREADVPVAWRE
jgi:clan AA aspartic protease (TIGR02281 family)